MHRVASIICHGLPLYLWMCRHMILTYKHTWLSVYLLNDLMRKISFLSHITNETERFAWQFFALSFVSAFSVCDPWLISWPAPFIRKSLAWIPQEGQRLALCFSMVFWAMLHHCPMTFYSAYPLEQPTRPGPLGSITVFLSPRFHAKHTFWQWCCSLYVAGCFRKKEELVGIKTLAEQAWCLEFAIRNLYIQIVCLVYIWSPRTSLLDGRRLKNFPEALRPTKI